MFFEFLGDFIYSKGDENFVEWEKMLNFAVAFGKMGRFQSGQMGQTVNLLRHRFGGSNPSLPTFIENPRPVRAQA